MVIEVSHTISMGHRLPSYDGICSSPHGHNVRIVAELSAPSFLDFKHVDDVLKRELYALDHAMVLQQDDKVLAALHGTGLGLRLVGLSVEPTTENIAQLVFNRLSQTYKDKLVRVTVHETDKYSATARGYDGSVYAVHP